MAAQTIGMSKWVRDACKRYRVRLLIATCLVAAVGITSRVVPIGSLIWDKYVGDVVYAAVFYLVLSLIWAEGTITAKMILTAVYVVAIEVFQLTPIPVRLNQSENLVIRAFAYVVLGSTFSWWDLLAYSIGIAGILALDKWYLRA